MIQSTECRQPGDRIGLSLTPNDIHVMHKSEYSGKFGDYSTFSDEMGEDIMASDEAASQEMASQETDDFDGTDAGQETEESGKAGGSGKADAEREGRADEI